MRPDGRVIIAPRASGNQATGSPQPGRHDRGLLVADLDPIWIGPGSRSGKGSQYYKPWVVWDALLETYKNYPLDGFPTSSAELERDAAMFEQLDIRLYNDWANEEFGDSIGEPMYDRPKADWEKLDAKIREYLRPLARRVVIRSDDPFFPELSSRILRAEKKGRVVATSISVARVYTKGELDHSEFVQVILFACFQQGGEDYGTVYDDTSACPKCGLGRVQRSPLRLDLSKSPKHTDIARTLAMREWVVSERVAGIIGAESVTGVVLHPVEHAGKRGAGQSWYQLCVTGNAGKTCAPTRFGNDFIRDFTDERHICRPHDLLGLNLLTEVTLARAPSAELDAMTTTDRFGIFGGGLMPIPILIVSKRFYRILLAHNVKGVTSQPVHVKG